MKIPTTIKKVIPILALCALSLRAGAQSTSTVLVDFNSDSPGTDSTPSPDGSGLYWNNVSAATDGSPSAKLNGSYAPITLTNTTDGIPGWTLGVTNLPGGYGYNASSGSTFYNYSGPYPAAVSGFPSSALQDAMSVGSSGVSVTLSGLNSGNTYNLVLYGSTTTDSAHYGSGGFQTDTLTAGTSASPSAVHFNSVNNSLTVVAWNNVSPDTNGQIAFTIVPDSTNGGGDLNFLEVVEASTSQVPAPPTGLSDTAGNAKVTLTWTASAGATSYNVKRSTTSGAETTITNVTGVTFIDKQVSNGTTYYYKVSAVNATGESASSAEVSATPQAQIQALVDFNSDSPSTDNTPSPDGNGLYWNNVSVVTDGHIPAQLNGSYAPIPLVDTANGLDGWTLAVANLPGGYNYNAGSGSHYYNYSGPYPAALSSIPTSALMDSMSVGSSGVSVTISGLDAGSHYNVVLYGSTTTSSANYGSGGFQTDTLTVGASASPAAVDFNSVNNDSTIVGWTNVSPSADGQIAFTVVPDATNGGGDVNFLEVVEASATQSPPTATITNSLSGNTLSLTWPAGQGWRLVSQTNTPSAGLNPSPAAWSTVPGTTDGSYSVTVDASNGSVFYRLANP